MVLVDTSVWNQVVGHELVYGELLIGDKGGRSKLLTAYQLMRQAETIPHPDVVEFVRNRRASMASALVGRFRLWTADPRLDALAHELGVAYQLSWRRQIVHS